MPEGVSRVRGRRIGPDRCCGWGAEGEGFAAVRRATPAMPLGGATKALGQPGEASFRIGGGQASRRQAAARVRPAMERAAAGSHRSSGDAWPRAAEDERGSLYSPATAVRDARAGAAAFWNALGQTAFSRLSRCLQLAVRAAGP